MTKAAPSGRITQQSIEAVLQRSDLVDLVSGFTQLKKQGGEHTGRCPFHEERTPSFWVNPTKGVYHCFGCGASGDTVTFVQEKQGLDFVEAIEFLADRYRVTLEYDGEGKARSGPPKRRLYELLDTAASYYEAVLWKSSAAGHAREYLQRRNVTEETARAFRMGFSPDGADATSSRALQKGFTREELTEARLVTARGADFFRRRLMVPIVDRADRVLGFGARKLVEDQFGGKYINSADGRLFHKKETVFIPPGIRDAAAKAENVVVVEGYMDVIALWQAGFRNACAVMGTALTEQQIMELKRLAPRACFAFDPDTAGQVATLRALEMARQHELDVRVVLLPDGDPADVVGEPDGRDRMAELIDASVSLMHYRVSALLGSGDPGKETDRERLYREGVKFFAGIPDSPERKTQIDRFAFGLGLDNETVEMLRRTTGADQPLADLAPRRGNQPQAQRSQPAAGQGSGAPTRSPRDSALVLRERRLLATVVAAVDVDSNRDLSTLAIAETDFSLEVHRTLWRLLVAGELEQALARRDDEQLQKLHAEISTRHAPDEGEDAPELDELLREHSLRVRIAAREREIALLKRDIGSAGDDELRRLAQLNREVHSLNDQLVPAPPPVTPPAAN